MGSGTVTSTAAPNGAYGFGVGWTYNSGTSALDITGAGMAAFYRDNATSANGLGTGVAGYIMLSSAQKYGLATSADQTGGQIAVDGTADCWWYFPTEPATPPTGETDATGDRWNQGDQLTGLAGAGQSGVAATVDQACFSNVALTLGAAQLATAGVAALAAALAF